MARGQRYSRQGGQLKWGRLTESTVYKISLDDVWKYQVTEIRGCLQVMNSRLWG